MYAGQRPRRRSLPTYPFAKERYWIEMTAAPAQAPSITSHAHPFLHRNTSLLGRQRFTSTFSGQEFFLRDHRVRTDGPAAEHVLPAVAYLEMARAAMTAASPDEARSNHLELHDTVWLKPLVIADETQVSIALFVDDNGDAGFEIYSADDGDETVHCQGQAVFTPAPAPAPLDLARLRAAMSAGSLEPADVYARFAAMGLEYGPAQQGLVAITLGEQQLLAQLRLPSLVESTEGDYVLHPSIMDSALQASIGLIEVDELAGKPPLPFLLESIRVIAPCTQDMFAWVRYARGTTAGDAAIRLDLDVCDAGGNVCVVMRGFLTRVFDGGAVAAQAKRRSGDVRAVNSDAFDDGFYEKLIAGIASHELTVDEALELG
jgi:polyketide synthase PksN